MILYIIKTSIVALSILLLSSCESDKRIPIKIDVNPNQTEMRSSMAEEIENTVSMHMPISMKSISAVNLPQNIKDDLLSTAADEANLKGLLHWTDGDKIHIALLTHTLAKNANNGILHCYVYTSILGSIYERTLEIEEETLHCKNTTNLSFNKNQFLITDLDNDGYSELWLGYTIVCPESGEFKKELYLLTKEQTHKYNAMKGKFSHHFAAEIINFAKELWK